MKIYILTLTVILVFSAIGFGQTDLPITGSIADIKDLSKIYVVADNESRKAILKQVKKQKIFVIVDNPDDAELFIEYKTISRRTVAMMTTETGQMDVFIYRDKRKVIAWSDSSTGGGFNGDTANGLIKKFLKVTKKK